VYRLRAESVTIFVGMGTAVLRVFVVVLVFAAGPVARVACEQMVNRCRPKPTSTIASIPAFEKSRKTSSTRIEVIPMDWTRTVLKRKRAA